MSTTSIPQPPVELGAASYSVPVKELGICTTCNHARTCLFMKAARNPIWYCDEFDATGSQAESKPLVASLPKADGILFGEAVAVGLCVNCEVKTSCVHREPGKPVHECENYL